MGLTLMGLATGEGSSLQGKKLNSCSSKDWDCSHLATSEPRPSSTPLNIMLSMADALHASLHAAFLFQLTSELQHDTLQQPD